MDRRERTNDPIEAQMVALEGKQGEMWTALPGIINSFDSTAMTVSVQPSIKGKISDEKGKTRTVNLPLLVDVPVIFPSGGGFTLTYPIKAGDECLVIFSSRCIDGWWQNGGIGGTPDERMHDLSDGIAIIGPRSQPRKLEPSVDANNVQLRTDDGKSHITIKPDYTILASNPESSITMSPNGEISANSSNKIILDAPQITFKADSFLMEGRGDKTPTATIKANITQEGSHTSSGDQVAAGISQKNHVHKCAQCGTTQEPV